MVVAILFIFGADSAPDDTGASSEGGGEKNYYDYRTYNYLDDTYTSTGVRVSEEFNTTSSLTDGLQEAVDDLPATGGTMEAACKLVRRIGGQPVACVFAIELIFLNGRQRLVDIPCHSLAKY